MARTKRRQIRHYRRLNPNFVDGVALAAALLWLGLMVGLASSGNISLLTAIKRGLIGSMIVYLFVFVGLQIVLRLAYKTVGEREKQKRTPPASKQQEPIQEQASNTASPQG